MKVITEFINLLCRNKKLDLSAPQIMAILNLTPDSRYGSNYYHQIDAAVERAHQMMAEGATIIDIGGESTRPGATPITIQEELDRVMPVIEKLAKMPAILSLDTRHPEVMQEGIKIGIDMINDVNALQAEGALEIVAKSKVAVCLMHMQGQPTDMQKNPHYADVVAEVSTFLRQRFDSCLAAGIALNRICLDPGFGFGKNLQHNLQLLKNLHSIVNLGLPVLVGLSRKSMLEKLLGLPVEERLPASIALAVLAVQQGALIVRTHDVKPTYEAIKTAIAVMRSS